MRWTVPHSVPSLGIKDNRCLKWGKNYYGSRQLNFYYEVEILLLKRDNCYEEIHLVKRLAKIATIWDKVWLIQIGAELTDWLIYVSCILAKKWPHEQNFELGWREVTPGAFSWQFQMTPYPTVWCHKCWTWLTYPCLMFAARDYKQQQLIIDKKTIDRLNRYYLDGSPTTQMNLEELKRWY